MILQSNSVTTVKTLSLEDLREMQREHRQVNCLQWDREVCPMCGRRWWVQEGQHRQKSREK